MRVVTRCDGYIGFYTETLIKLRASIKEAVEVFGIEIYMGG